MLDIKIQLSKFVILDTLMSDKAPEHAVSLHYLITDSNMYYLTFAINTALLGLGFKYKNIYKIRIPCRCMNYM